MKCLLPITLSFSVALALSGCGKTEEPAEETAAAPATETVEKTQTDAGKALAETGKQGMEATADAAANLTKKGDELAQEAVEQGADIVEAAVEKAKELIATLKQHLADNDIDLASKTMEQLRAMKDSLPESLQEQIDQLEQMLSGAASPQSH